jgi:hypothetical protein
LAVMFAMLASGYQLGQQALDYIVATQAAQTAKEAAKVAVGLVAAKVAEVDEQHEISAKLRAFNEQHGISEKASAVWLVSLVLLAPTAVQPHVSWLSLLVAALHALRESQPP